MNLNGLYVITDDILTPQKNMLDQVKSSLEGGAKIVQLRDKKSSIDDIANKALQLEKLCKDYGAIFVLNDEVELAIKLGLSGLHVGKSDYHRMGEIRENFSGYLGVSCYGDLEIAKDMENLGVDYVAFGSFFKSPTKPQSKVVDLSTLGKAKKLLNIPICAIGGINIQNIADVMRYSPDMVAVISDIWKSQNIKNQATNFANYFKESR
jgi:thiamine-phosphate pyrophosphorylase